MHKKTATRIASVLLFIIIVVLVVAAIRVTPILFELLFKKEITLKKANTNLNVLLLGAGGGRHEGPDLTDTIIFASLDLEKNKVTFVSVPRDLWVPTLDAKVNNAYASGEEKKEGSGLILAKAVVSDILDKPIDYAVRVDFDGFVKAVDLVGGIDVNVERTLDDYAYPVVGKEQELCGHTEDGIASFSAQIATASATEFDIFPCRYTHLHVDSGLQHMDGEKALKFVRSRHALGKEGSDFARSKRQEKVINAFKDRIFSLDTLVNPLRVIALYDTLRSNINTDIKDTEFDDFIKLAQKMKKAKIKNVVLDFGDEETGRAGLLINPLPSSEYRLQWVVIPRIGNGNFSEIQKHVSCEIKNGPCTVPITPIPLR